MLLARFSLQLPVAQSFAHNFARGGTIAAAPRCLESADSRPDECDADLFNPGQCDLHTPIATVTTSGPRPQGSCSGCNPGPLSEKVRAMTSMPPASRAAAPAGRAIGPPAPANGWRAFICEKRRIRCGDCRRRAFLRCPTGPDAAAGRFHLDAELPIPLHGIGRVEVDLICADAALTMELDGVQHVDNP
jgi:hypothetical protein